MSVLRLPLSKETDQRTVYLLCPLTGTPHKKQRKMLSPIFSLNQIRALTPIFHKVSDEVRHYAKA